MADTRTGPLELVLWFNTAQSLTHTAGLVFIIARYAKSANKGSAEVMYHKVCKLLVIPAKAGIQEHGSSISTFGDDME